MALPQARCQSTSTSKVSLVVTSSLETPMGNGRYTGDQKLVEPSRFPEVADPRVGLTGAKLEKVTVVSKMTSELGSGRVESPKELILVYPVVFFIVPREPGGIVPIYKLVGKAEAVTGIR
ncbi:hypothetical protein PM082_007948 [Marasmius tenuissimus]|nr:hypothetical protein PM082_007948 [Marasmius tenuissimus]